jgi:hypothetical protein
MKNIFIAASLLVISCNYKSENERKIEEALLTVKNNKSLIHTNEISLDAEIGMLNATNRLIKAMGRITPQHKIIIETTPLKIENLKAEIDSLKTDTDRLEKEISNLAKQQ